MAADLDVTVGGNTALSENQRAATYKIHKYVDVAAIIAADAGADLASATKITAAENIAVIDIPIYTWVQMAVCQIIEAATGTATIDIGDGDDVEGWDAAVDITAAAGTVTYSNNDVDAFSLQIASGKVYGSAADQLDILFNNDTTNGKFLITLVCVDLSCPQYDVN